MIAVVDGLGGSIGAEIISRLRQELGNKIKITALATNAVASAKMLKSGANLAASGENAFLVNIPKAKLIIGPTSIVIPNSYSGELTPQMAETIANSPSKKILIPITGEDIEVVGLTKNPLPHLMDEVIEKVLIEQRTTKFE
ncbi:MAG: DUF3842 family protein [Actinobacteria bacterium]|nr:MAG: DUF3842 family protein [Actinomycetota bacterium]